MTPRIGLFALVVVALSGCSDGILCRGAGCREIGNGIELAERRELGQFSAVQSSGSIDVDVAVGSPPSAAVRGDENIVPLVRTRVKNGTLVIDTERGYSTRLGLTVKVTAPRLDGVAVSGSGSICAQGVDAERPLDRRLGRGREALRCPCSRAVVLGDRPSIVEHRAHDLVIGHRKGAARHIIA